MPQANVRRTRFECANPILSVADMSRSLRYYVEILGFSNAEWGSDDFTCVSRDGASIYLCKGDQGEPGTWVWVGVEDVQRCTKSTNRRARRFSTRRRIFPGHSR